MTSITIAQPPNSLNTTSVGNQTNNNAVKHNNQPSAKVVTISRVYYIVKALLIFPDLAENFLKNIFCLETLRHGTSMRNVILIKQNGGDPRKGDFEGEKT
jgi:hypothetical protein